MFGMIKLESLFTGANCMLAGLVVQTQRQRYVTDGRTDRRNCNIRIALCIAVQCSRAIMTGMLQW